MANFGNFEFDIFEWLISTSLVTQWTNHAHQDIHSDIGIYIVSSLIMFRESKDRRYRVLPELGRKYVT